MAYLDETVTSFQRVNIVKWKPQNQHLSEINSNALYDDLKHITSLDISFNRKHKQV